MSKYVHAIGGASPSRRCRALRQSMRSLAWLGARAIVLACLLASMRMQASPPPLVLLLPLCLSLSLALLIYLASPTEPSLAKRKDVNRIFLTSCRLPAQKTAYVSRAGAGKQASEQARKHADSLAARDLSKEGKESKASFYYPSLPIYAVWRYGGAEMSSFFLSH
ncbi:hypothetical protein IWX50DRAFT_76842 [Phyllosticta citricarpa]